MTHNEQELNRRMQAMLAEAIPSEPSAAQLRHNQQISLMQVDAWREDIRKAHSDKSNWPTPIERLEKVKLAISEAIGWMHVGAPGRAVEVLERALMI